jgi:hypothetical protein
MLARKEADGRFPQFQETGHRAEHSNVELDVLYVGEFDFQTVSAAASVTEIHSPQPFSGDVAPLLLTRPGVLGVEQPGRVLRWEGDSY